MPPAFALRHAESLCKHNSGEELCRSGTACLPLTQHVPPGRGNAICDPASIYAGDIRSTPTTYVPITTTRIRFLAAHPSHPCPIETTFFMALPKRSGSMANPPLFTNSDDKQVSCMGEGAVLVRMPSTSISLRSPQRQNRPSAPPPRNKDRDKRETLDASHTLTYLCSCYSRCALLVALLGLLDRTSWLGQAH
ncbi:hypothetical protein LZ32DRAFT_2247 [Colletotrichum eremochloae]|nr:hypothetical protein LZ32DRAFT_2247 [Colletotrichum eremochloae]